MEQARQRWAALRRFARARGHLLVTNGPYRLDKWTNDTVVLQVFRDFSYPLGVGVYDRYALPLLNLNTGCDIAAGVFMFLLVRHWRRRLLPAVLQ